MYTKALVIAGAVMLGSAATAATTPIQFDNNLDSVAIMPLTVSQPVVADLFSSDGFTDRFFDGSVAYDVKVSFELTGSPSVVDDDVSFGVGTARDDYSLGSTGPSGAISFPFMFMETFRVNAGEELFVNFALNNIKGGGYEYEVTAVAAPQIPLPAALPLIASGLAALGFVGARRRKG